MHMMQKIERRKYGGIESLACMRAFRGCQEVYRVDDELQLWAN